MDYTVHWILQARILEWVVFPFSRGSSQPRDRIQSPTLQVDSFFFFLQVDSLPAEPQGKPINSWVLCLFKYWETVEVIFLQPKDHDSKISSYIKLDGDIWYIIWGLSRHLQQQGTCPECFPPSPQKGFLSKRFKEHFYIRVSSKIKRRGEDLCRTANSQLLSLSFYEKQTFWPLKLVKIYSQRKGQFGKLNNFMKNSLLYPYTF